jgi:N-acetylneuraminic acid mutarotase
MKTQIIGLLLVLFCNIFPINGQVEWQTKANRLISGQCKAVAYKGKIYVSTNNTGSNFIIEEYNPKTDTWLIKKAVSHIKNGGEYCIAATDAGIYIMGGYWNNAPSKKMEKYDVEKDTFLMLNDMPAGLDCATAASVNNNIFIIGGSPDNDILASNKVYAYNADNDNWTEKQGAPNSRREAQAEVIQDKIYLFGGFTQQGPKNSIDVYDPKTNSWAENNYNLMGNNKLLIGMGVAKNEIYFISGIINNNGVNTEELFKYNPESNSVIKVSDLFDLTWLMGRVSLHDSIYFIGGIKGEFPNGEKQNSTLLLRLAN